MNLLASLAARGAGLPLADAATSRPETPSSAEAVPLMTGPLEPPPAEEPPAPATPPFPNIDQLSAQVRDRALAEIRALQPPPAVLAPQIREATAFLRPGPPEPPPIPTALPPETALSERVVQIVRTESPTIVQRIVERELLSASPSPRVSDQQPLSRPADHDPERQVPQSEALQPPPDQPELLRAPEIVRSVQERFEAPPRPVQNVTQAPVLPRVDGQPVISMVSAERSESLEPGPIPSEVPRPRVLRSKDEIVRREILREATTVRADAPDGRHSEPTSHEAAVPPASLARPAPPPPARAISTERAKERTTSGPARPPIEVRIGTIEIRAPQAAAPAATVEKSPVQPSAPPEGFDAYRGMRAYQGWWRGA